MDKQNYFEQEYEAFRATALYASLQKKFLPIPYWKKYRVVRFITLVASYLFNILSGITAASLVYFSLLGLSNDLVAITGTLIMITILEMLKRKLSSLTFKEYLMNKRVLMIPLIFLINLSIISISSSYFGSKEMVFQLSKPASIVIDATKDIDLQISDISRQIEEARGTKWLGTTTSNSQATITSLNNQKELLLTEKLRIQERIDFKNDRIENDHLKQLRVSANHFAMITLLLEIFFLISAFYLQYYDFRSYVEFLKPLPIVATEEKPEMELLPEAKEEVVATDIPPDIIIAAIKNARSNLSAFESKIKKGDGNLATNRKGIKRWQNKLEELEEMLPKNGVHT